MTLVVVKIVNLNQSGVIWNKITVVQQCCEKLKRKLCRFIRRVKRDLDIVSFMVSKNFVIER